MATPQDPRHHGRPPPRQHGDQEVKPVQTSLLGSVSLLQCVYRYLPLDLLPLLASQSSLEWDGRLVRADSTCRLCGKIFISSDLVSRHISQVCITHSLSFIMF